MAERLLITGGAGFIGSNFVHYWVSKSPDDYLVVLDALTYAGNPANLAPLADHPNLIFVHGDIRDQSKVESLLREHRLSTIVNFAAESHVDRSITGPDLFIEVNVVGTHSLLKAARQVWLTEGKEEFPEHRFHHVSTDEVYGSLGPEDPPFRESTQYAPNSPYAASKAASDHFIRAYQETYGLQTTVSNCSNNYGPFHFPEKLIPLCIVNLLEGKELPIYGDGKNIRDWLYVEDHCRGIESILKKGTPGETYNIGGSSERTNLEVVRRICSALDERFAQRPDLSERFPKSPPANGQKSDGQITYVTDRLGHDWRYAIDARRITQELGFQPATTFEQGIELTVDWYLDNEVWWRAVMDRSYREWIDTQYGTS
jgi:dTDP-glucose 4,6-dehydratase